MLKRVVILLLLCLPVVCMTVIAQSVYKVTTQTLNVRSGPSTQYPVRYKLHYGDKIVVHEQSGQWAKVQINGSICYVNCKYLTYVGEASNQTGKKTQAVTIWDKLYRVVEIILWILAAVVVIGFFVNQTVSGLALWMQIMCGIGAFIGWLFWDNGTAGAVVTMGIELLIAAFIIYLLIKSSYDFEAPRASGFMRFIWAIISLPFYILNLLQFWLAKPWRPFMKRNTLPDSSKPAMRTFLRILQIPFYIVVTPLRFINAVYYNLLIYNLFAWSNYIIEVFIPSDDEEGADGVLGWLKYIPLRIVKYLLWHGVLTTIESVVWTIIDTFVPAVTLYHGTAVEYADNMLCDPHRNYRRKKNKGWLTGVWNVGGGNYAGDGIYFGIFRKTMRNYEQGSAIATRVTMGKTIDTVLMPDRVYAAAGHPDAKAVSNWGLNNGYVCGEWWRSDRGTNWWEICMYDRQNRYNESWRIRPIYAIHAGNGIMQRIPGGPAHWLFRKQVIKDIQDTLKK